MNLDDYIAERTGRDSEFRDAMAALEPEYGFRRALIAARLAAGLTQAELAARVGTKQPAIARLETGTKEPSLGMLTRLAKALDVTFHITPSQPIETIAAHR
jgi:transcriptional regulator with XRE-family HTH domain